MLKFKVSIECFARLPVIGKVENVGVPFLTTSTSKLGFNRYLTRSNIFSGSFSSSSNSVVYLDKPNNNFSTPYSTMPILRGGLLDPNSNFLSGGRNYSDRISSYTNAQWIVYHGLPQVHSANFKLTQEDRSMAVVSLVLDNRPNVRELKQDLINLGGHQATGGTFLNIDSSFLCSLDKCSPMNGSGLDLSLVDNRKICINHREQFITKVLEKFTGEHLNYIFKAENIGKSIIIKFNDGTPGIKMCNQPNGDYIVNYEGFSYIVDLKRIGGTNFSHGTGIINTHIGLGMDNAYFYDINRGLFNKFNNSISTPQTVIDSLLRLTGVNKALKHYKTLDDKSKVSKMLNELFKLNFEKGPNNKFYFPINIPDVGHSNYREAYIKNLIMYTNLGEFNKRRVTLIDEIGEVKCNSIAYVMHESLKEKGGYLSKADLLELSAKIDAILDNK
jgi:hypothetical protein